MQKAQLKYYNNYVHIFASSIKLTIEVWTGVSTKLNSKGDPVPFSLEK